MPVRKITAEVDGKQRTIVAEVPEGATEQDILSAVEEYLSAESPPQSAQRSVAKDVLAGFGSGVLSTATTLADYNPLSLASRKILGTPKLADDPFIARLGQAPPSTAGTVGRMVEGGAEFMVPLARLAKATRALPFLQRAGVQAAGGAGTAAFQSRGDPFSMALGGAAGAVGAGIGKAFEIGSKIKLSDLAQGVQSTAFSLFAPPWLKTLATATMRAQKATQQASKAMNPTSAPAPAAPATAAPAPQYGTRTGAAAARAAGTVGPPAPAAPATAAPAPQYGLTPELLDAMQRRVSLRGMLSPAPTVTPPPPDTSGISVVRAARSIQRDPRTGRMQRVYQSTPEGTPELPSMTIKEPPAVAPGLGVKKGSIVRDPATGRMQRTYEFSDEPGAVRPKPETRRNEVYELSRRIKRELGPQPEPAPKWEAHQFKEAAQQVKAEKLATLLREHGISLEDARLMQPDHWAKAAQAAGVKAPSKESVSRALFELGKLERGSQIK